MLSSMTGYGRATGSFPKREITVEIRSVNHRYLECSVRLPRAYGFLEDGIKSAVASAVHRGKLEVGVAIQPAGEQQAVVEPNLPVVKGYLDAIRTMERELELESSPIRALDLARFPDAFRVLAEPLDEQEVSSELSRVLEEALASFCAMRRTEGEKLQADLQQRLESIERLLDGVEELASGFLQRYTERLYQRMQTVLESADIDDSRILTEAALYADRSAVDEETVRLRSHISQFRQIVGSGGPVGRKLDFLIQEFNREANTIGSKSSDLAVTGAVVNIKSEIEKIREQIQNVE